MCCCATISPSLYYESNVNKPHFPIKSLWIYWNNTMLTMNLKICSCKYVQSNCTFHCWLKSLFSCNAFNIIFEPSMFSAKFAKLFFTLCVVGSIVNLKANTKCEKTYSLGLSSLKVYVQLSTWDNFSYQLPMMTTSQKHSKYILNKKQKIAY